MPGDLIFLRQNLLVPCDCILLDGTVLVNEATLTGESLPIIKTPFDLNNRYDELITKKHTLFSGTSVIKFSNLENASY